MNFPMTLSQQIITLAIVIIATVLTRFLPYLAFPEGKKIPDFVRYLGRYLGPAVFGMLVVYCFKNVSFTSGSHGIPELLASAAVILLYLWKRNMVVPLAGGTILYMILVQAVFH